MTPAERHAQMRRKIAENASTKGRSQGHGSAGPTTEDVLAAAKARMREALGPDVPLPLSLAAIDEKEARDHRDDEIERLSREGFKVSAISVMLGVSYPTVVAVRHKREINPRKPRQS